METKFFTQVLKSNQQGSGMVMALMVAVALGGGLFAYQAAMDRANKNLKETTDLVESNIALDKLRTLGSFLISSNTIICKEGKFQENRDDETYRCIWTGKQLVNGALQDITKSKIGFDEGKYDEEGFLTYNIDSSKVQPDDEDIRLTNFKGKIGFKLYNALEDKLKISHKFGTVPAGVLEHDNDRAIVLMKVNLAYDEYQGEEKVPTPRSYSTYFSTRRPIAIPQITVHRFSCRQGCDVSVGRNDNPACRGDQNFERTKDVKYDGVTENLGPGVLYDLKVLKKITYDRKYFPSLKADPEPRVVNVMGGKDYLLPKERVSWSDSMECIEVETQMEVFKSGRDGKCYTERPAFDDEGNFPIDSGKNKLCSGYNRECMLKEIAKFETSCESPDLNAEQHGKSYGTISYEVDVSPYRSPANVNDPEDRFWLLKKRMRDIFVSLNHRVKEDEANTTETRIEPARTATVISSSNDAPVIPSSDFSVTPTH